MMRKSRRPRDRANAQSTPTSRGSSTTTTVASRKGAAGSTIASSTAELPSQRSVVRGPMREGPLAARSAARCRLRMLRWVPNANHSITMSSSAIAIDGPEPSSAGMRRTVGVPGTGSTHHADGALC